MIIIMIIDMNIIDIINIHYNNDNNNDYNNDY